MTLSLTDGLCDATDSKLRNHCADLVAEFFHWSIKQSTKAEVADNPAGAKRVIEKLLIKAAHPNEANRLGAANAFNKIYRSMHNILYIPHYVQYALMLFFCLIF